MKFNFKKLLKYFSIGLLSIILLLTIAIFSLQFPAVQNFVKDKLVNYLENKIQTKVQLDKVYVDFPNSLVMENLFLQGQDVDTLLYVKKFDVGLDIWQLTNSKADIKSIDLEGVNANVVRKKDGTFNFDYILNAFATNEKEESDSKPFIVSLDKIKLNDIRVSFVDKQAANNLKVYLNSFDTRVKKFDLQQNSYGIGDINLDGLKLKLKQDLVKEVTKKVEEKIDSLNDQKPIKIELNGINLTNFDIDYGDYNSGMFAKVQFKDFKTHVKNLDLQQNSYKVGDILLNDLFLDFKQKNNNQSQQNTAQKTESNSVQNPMLIALSKINLNNINVNYGDENSGMFAKINLKELETKINKIDLGKNAYDVGDILLNDLVLDFKQKNNNQSQQNTTQKTEPTSSQNPMQIALNKINLNKVNVNYGDENSRMFAKVNLNKFETKINKIDLDKNAFDVGDILLNGLKLDFKQKLILQPQRNTSNTKPTSSQNPMQIALNKINLNEVNVNYGDENSRTFAKVNLNKFETKINKIDLKNSNFNLDKIILKDANIEANLHLPPTQSTSTQATSSAPIKLVLDKTILDNVKIKYSNTAERKTAQGMDFNHLNFSKLNLDLRNFKMQNNTFAGRVQSAEIRESKGLNIQQFRTNFLYADRQAYLKNLHLQTPRTVLRDEIILKYNNINQLTKNPENVLVNANIKNSRISFSDILNLVPSLRKTAPFDKYPNAVLQVNANVNGRVNNLLINNLHVSGLDDLQISASGRVQNAMNPKKLAYDLNIRNLSISSKTIYNLVPKNTIPANIRIPSRLSVTGNAKGTTEVIDTKLVLNSTLGNAKIDANVDMRVKDAEKYNVKANLQNLDVGTLISNKDLGKITADLTAIGTSFNPEKMVTTLNGTIASAHYNNYTYQNIALDAKINESIFDAHIISNDPNANLDLAASGVYKKELSNVKLNGNIVKLDVKKIGFYKEPLTIVAGKIEADMADLNPDMLNGSFYLKNFAISNNKDVLKLREVSLNATSTAESNHINLTSQIADLDIKGRFKLTQILGSLTSTFNQFYEFQKPNELEKIEPNQYFTLNAKIKNDDLIRRFVPDLTTFETITLDATYDADNRKINVNGNIPTLTYGTNIIKNGTLKLYNQNDALLYSLDVGALQSESFKLNKINLYGDIANNIINYTASTRDDKNVTQFLVAGNLKTQGDITEIRLNQNGLILNYDQWKVGEGNLIQLRNDGFVAHNFRLLNNGSEIYLQSESNKGTSPLNIFIKNFKIETIAEIIKKDDLPAEGTINGTAQIRDLSTNMTFNADLEIVDLKAFGNPIGNLVAKIKNTSPDIIKADVSLTGNNNDLSILGNYNTKESLFDLALNINRLEMSSIQGFSMNQIKDTEGYLSGKLNLTGSMDRPNLLGQVKFNNVGLTIAQTGSNFRKIDDAIDFTRRGIEFNRFRINDKDGNTLTVNGQVLTQTYQDFAFNLSVNARDFNVINSEKSNDAMMYGKLAVNANLNIRGNLDLPRVSGNLAVTDKTDFTFVMPQSSPSLQNMEGIVEFINQNEIALQEKPKKDEINTGTNITGLDVSVNIEVDKEAKTTIVIDKVNGDFVEIQGEAKLTGGVDPSGNITLTGVYKVEKGAYELSVSLLKRRFDFQKGSTITFTGEPTTANLDITAIYKTRAAPIDLVEQQISGYSSSEMNMYKQRIPFNAELILKGELLKPEISFNISMDKDNSSIATSVKENTQAKLDQLRNDEAEMNKQVFSLLLLNRFIGENPFQSQSTVSAETIALQSVSNILSQQLNNLASDLIQGIDIDFGLDTQDDYSSGTRNTRTDLNVALSKRLLNDRLKVSVGSNFGIDGDARENENMTNIAGDITIDYNLSRDGRYMLRAYRKNEYQVALQGQIVETGVGFIITLDYNKFREIFENKRKNKANKKTQKEESKP